MKVRANQSLLSTPFDTEAVSTSADSAQGGASTITCRVIDSAPRRDPAIGLSPGLASTKRLAVWERAASKGEKRPRLIIRVAD